jgi:hypothetical protein
MGCTLKKIPRGRGRDLLRSQLSFSGSIWNCSTVDRGIDGYNLQTRETYIYIYIYIL